MSSRSKLTLVFSILVVVAVVGGSALIATLLARQDAPEQAPPRRGTQKGRMAFVDMLVVLVNYPQLQQRTDFIEGINEDRKLELEELRKQVDLLEERARQHRDPLGSSIHRDYFNAATNYKRKAELYELRSKRNYAEAYADTYKEIYEAIKEEAAAQGYDVVFNVDAPEIRSGTTEQLWRKIVGRNVVVWPAGDDLTNAVIERLGGTPPGGDSVDGDSAGDDNAPENAPSSAPANAPGSDDNAASSANG